MPNASSVHPNISGNINSTTAPAPGYAPAQNVPAQNNINVPQLNETQNINNWVFYFTILIIILIIIIFIYKKLRKNS